MWKSSHQKRLFENKVSIAEFFLYSFETKRSLMAQCTLQVKDSIKTVENCLFLFCCHLHIYPPDLQERVADTIHRVTVKELPNLLPMIPR